MKFKPEDFIDIIQEAVYDDAAHIAADKITELVNARLVECLDDAPTVYRCGHCYQLQMDTYCECGAIIPNYEDSWQATLVNKQDIEDTE